MNAVKLYRMAKEMTGVALAYRIGVHPSYVTQIERYETVSKLYASKLSRALGVRMDELFDAAERAGRYRARNLKVKTEKKK